MNLKINFLKFKKEKRFKKDSLDLDVNSHWKLLLYIALVVILVAFAFGLYIFSLVNKDFTVQNVKINSQMEKVKKDRVNSILNYFVSKEQKNEVIINSVSPVVDPSR